MKKLVLFFVAVVAVSFASCGGAKTEQAPATDSVAAVVEEVTEAVVDTATNDTLATDTTVVVAE
ncbi:MAG: PG1828 family lipoprotein [Bacteroidales bacterium]